MFSICNPDSPSRPSVLPSRSYILDKRPPRYSNYSDAQSYVSPVLISESTDFSQFRPWDFVDHCDSHAEDGTLPLNLPPLSHSSRFGLHNLASSTSALHGHSFPLSSALEDPSSNYLSISKCLSSSQKSEPLENPSHGKIRKERPKIALAPDQPPTTHGKPRTRVYVACLQCRTRKIRCDGARPVCHNCDRRSINTKECDYDTVPKRRGPDRIPGARQKVASDLKNGLVQSRRRRRRRRDSVHSTPTSASTSHQLLSTSPEPSLPSHCQASSSTQTTPLATPYSPGNYVHYVDSHSSISKVQCTPGYQLYTQTHPYASSTLNPHIVPSRTVGYHITDVGESDKEQPPDEKIFDITPQPSVDFTQKTWWDSLLSLYVSTESYHVHPLTSSQREQTSQSVTSDIRYIFRTSNYWFSFFHIPTFFRSYLDPQERERIQPSLVLSLLAMSIFWQSSEQGLGHEGRKRALRFRDEAQGSLEASFNAGWVDERLAQAAWLLALFEICAHPLHTLGRTVSSMALLDNIIRSLSLTFVDIDDPKTTVFPSGAVPVVLDSTISSPVPEDARMVGYSRHVQAQSPSVYVTRTECSCQSLTLGMNWQATQEYAPMWESTPTWDDSWSEAEIRKESCRRLCWSAMTMAAGHTAYASAQHQPIPQLYITDPSNYALLFSGESITRSPLHHLHSKDTIWALHDRAFLLWHSCIRMRSNPQATDSDKTQFAVKAWLETDIIEAALNRHTCDIERRFIFQGREYIFNIRMCISYEFQQYIPLVPVDINAFHRQKAEEWLTHQSIVAQRLTQGLHTVTGLNDNHLRNRPFFVFWFMGQVSRALDLFSRDRTMLIALDVCKLFLPSIELLSSLWPCAGQRERYSRLREKLQHACYIAGIEPIPPANLYSQCKPL